MAPGTGQAAGVTARASAPSTAAATKDPVLSAAPPVTPHAPRPWWVTREREYAGATCAALVCGMAVRRRGDVLHVRTGRRWHALAVVPAGVDTGARRSQPPTWVHVDLDRQDWFTFGRGRRVPVPSGSGWHAVRWLAVTAA